MTKLVCSLLLLALACLSASVVSASLVHPRDEVGASGTLASLTAPSAFSSLAPGAVDHEQADHEDHEPVDHAADQAMVEVMARSRTSTPYLHELKARVDAEAEAELDEELMSRVEGKESAAEIRKLLEPYLHPKPTAHLSHESVDTVEPSILASQASQRALRTQHMKHVLEMKYAKMHAQQRAGAEAEAESTTAQVSEVTNHTVSKSSEDTRAYRFLSLDNGLRVVLVSDPNTTKSAAAMDVGNGYLSDPREVPGLAHFLEHMLFLGTTKYPSESAYADFIESHGGFSNAYTGMENTNFYFDILPNHLVGALDRFAQFFIAPTLMVNTTEREMKAVDAEHSKNILSDNWRANRLLQDIANATHPYSKFGTGCARTLDVMPHEEMVGHLRAFWQRHYTAGNLVLTVLGAESLDDLQKVVDEKFADIAPTPDEGAFDPLAGTKVADLFNATILGSEVFVNTIEDQKFLSLVFPMASQYPAYKYQALAYVRALVEGRGKGSLLKQLKNKGWATGVQLGVDAGTSAFSTVQFSVDLTALGSTRVDEIVGAFFAFLRKVRKHGIQQWRFAEMQQISNLTFTYKDKEQPSDYISKLASNLRHYPPEHLLVGGKVFLEYNEQAIQSMVDALQPKSMLVVLGGKDLNHEMRFREQWYGIEYDVRPIAPERLKAFEKGTSKVVRKEFKFALPKPNTFLPKNLTVNPPLLNPVPRPILLHESLPNVTDGSKRLWYSEDLEFHRPHGHAVFRMYVPHIYASARNYLLTNIYVNLLEDQVDEELFPALMAGFNSHFRVGTCYLDLIFHGYNQGLVAYGQAIAAIMNPASTPAKGKKSSSAAVRGFQPDENRFKSYKETLLQSYLNKKYEAPHRQSSALLGSLLDPRHISNYDLVRTLELLTFADVRAWPAVLFGDMSLEAYVHGNVSPKDAKQMLKIFVRHMPFQTTTAAFNHVPTRNHYLPRPRLGQVKDDVAVTMLASNPAETNSAVVKYWQFGMGGIEGKLYSQLLALIGQKPIFHQLRTLEQLGYIVWSSADNRLDVNGFKIQVQSGRRPAHYLSERIDAFLGQFQQTLGNMTQKQFEVYIETLMMSKLQSPVSMAVQTSWFWNEISKQEYVFQRKEIELYILNATQIINRAGFQTFVQKLFYISNVDNPGMEACEMRGGGVLSVRVESPVPQVPIVNNATAALKAKKAALLRKADAVVKRHKGGKLSGGKAAEIRKATKKKVATSPSPAAKAKIQKLKAKATKKKVLKEKADQELPAKSLLAVDSEMATELDALAAAQDAAAAEADAEFDAETEAEANAALLETEAESESEAEGELESESEGESELDAEAEAETEADADADADADSSEEMEFVELSTEVSHAPHSEASSVSHESHGHAHQPQQADAHYELPHATAAHTKHAHTHSELSLHAHVESAKKPRAKKQLIKGAGPFVTANQAAKSTSVSSLDQPIVVLTRGRDGGLYLLNTTQSTVHVFTNSLMLYPRNRYEEPPRVTRWKNVQPKKKVKATKKSKGKAALRKTRKPVKKVRTLKEVAKVKAKKAPPKKANQLQKKKQQQQQRKKKQAATNKSPSVAKQATGSAQ